MMKMKISDLYAWPGITISGFFALFAFILFFSDTGEPMKSFVAAIFVFFLTWLSYTVLRWIYEMF